MQVPHPHLWTQQRPGMDGLCEVPVSPTRSQGGGPAPSNVWVQTSVKQAFRRLSRQHALFRAEPTEHRGSHSEPPLS